MTRGFRLDAFQRRSIESLDKGHSVIVAAPTGAGKTVVAEHAVARALQLGRRAFYTTPIKALSNQKFRDLRAEHGDSSVGLMTGDNVIGSDAPIIVMTTEVLRNMLYAGSPAIEGLEFVVLDEVHYLQDTYRGPVWEEVIVHLPRHIRLVCLSATVSNARELADWITVVRGQTDLVVEEKRPVPLRNLYLVGDRSAERDHLLATLVDGKANPEAERFDDDRRAGNHRGGRGRRRWHTPRRVAVVDRLEAEEMLPAIVFVFSRAGCDEAVRTLTQAGRRHTDPVRRDRVRDIAARHTTPLSGTDLEVLGHDRWLWALQNGVAAHHAGMVPAFKEAVEEAFSDGLLDVVFATETLALGVNMPARTVVIENLSKFTGETHELLTPSQYTQLTGRAGRRGIDELGQAVVLWSPYVAFAEVAALASSRSFRLTSAFRPTYNMAANLVRRYERDEALRLLRQSFAQFQIDRAVVAAEQQIVRRRDEMSDLRRAMAGPGDLEEFVELRRRSDRILADDREHPEHLASLLAELRPGDLVLFEGGRAAVISVAFRRGAVKLRLLLPSGDTITRTAAELTEPLERRGSIELPEPYAPNHHGFLHEAALRLKRARLGNARPSPLPALLPEHQAILDLLAEHPCARAPDLEDRLAARSRLRRLESETRRSQKTADDKGESIARRFELVLGVLDLQGYTDGWLLTDRGVRLASLYHESDLLCAECLDTGVFDGLTPAELAAVASTLTYEHRSKTPSPAPRYPSRRMRHRVEEVEVRAEHLNAAERAAGLPLTRFPDTGFLAMAHRWVDGSDLDESLGGDDLSAGDFVRNIKTLRDLVRQIASLAPERDTRRCAAEAADSMRRGVVAASMTLGESGLADEVPFIDTIGAGE